jgi:hypothetical protein
MPYSLGVVELSREKPKVLLLPKESNEQCKYLMLYMRRGYKVVTYI